MSPIRSSIIHEFADTKKEGYCDKCGTELYRRCLEKLGKAKSDLKLKIQESIHSVSIVTTHSPYKWDYDIIGIVTGQSTTGTGVLTELTSSFSDLIGKQSNRHNEKIKYGEQLCSNQIRQQTIELGGNAIIATDIDCSELGGGKGMIMVCMSGTSIRINNIDKGLNGQPKGHFHV